MAADQSKGHADNSAKPGATHSLLPSDPAEILKAQLDDSSLSLAMNRQRTEARRRGASLRFLTIDGRILSIEAPAGMMRERLIERLREGQIVPQPVQS